MKLKGLLGSLAAVALVAGIYLVVSPRSTHTGGEDLRIFPEPGKKPVPQTETYATEEGSKSPGAFLSRAPAQPDKTGKDSAAMPQGTSPVSGQTDIPGAGSRDELLPDGHDGPLNRADPLHLWHTPDGSREKPEVIPDPLPPNVQARDIRVLPEALARLQVGQKLALPIPHEDHTYYGVIEERRVQLNGKVRVWSGRIIGGDERTSFTISQGESATRVMVATGENVYQVRMDKSSNLGSVIDEREFDRFHNPGDAMAWDHGGKP